MEVHSALALPSVLMAILAGPCLQSAGATVIPTQFLAKMYTEALGRAPDQTGWSAYVSYFQTNGCGAAQLAHVGEQFYASTEFASDYSDNAAKLLTLYRGGLSRDADQGGFNGYLARLNSGASWAAS
jgi:Domain of unknown function (DUF4214)